MLFSPDTTDDDGSTSQMGNDVDRRGAHQFSALRSADGPSDCPGGGAGDQPPRTVSVTSPPIGIEAEVFRNRLVGQVVPPGEATVVVESSTGPTRTVQADDLGFFVVPVMPPGRVRISCERPDSRLVTDWLDL